MQWDLFKNVEMAYLLKLRIDFEICMFKKMLNASLILVKNASCVLKEKKNQMKNLNLNAFFYKKAKALYVFIIIIIIINLEKVSIKKILL